VVPCRYGSAPVLKVVGEDEEGGGCLLWHHPVSEEPEKILAGSQSQPINHALNKGLRSSRGQVGGGPENSGPKIEVIRSGWERAHAQACSFSGRLFLLAVFSEWSTFFPSRAAHVAQGRWSISWERPSRLLRTGPVLPAAPPWFEQRRSASLCISPTAALGSVRSPALPR
jgi:hypothetical protein